jgi:putative ABC transport system substrate-binding protein
MIPILQCRWHSLRAFREGLATAGFTEGRNVAVEYRWAEGNNERLPALAAELVRHPVNVLVAPGSVASALAAKAATQTIPIVFESGDDPVATGLVASMNRPGGNVTGITSLNSQVALKRLELLHEIAPGATSLRHALAVACSRARDRERRILQRTEQTTCRTGVASFGSRGSSVPGFYRCRWPAELRWQLPQTHSQAGAYAGRILKGEKPGELPVVQVTTVELTVNLKTAKALGVNIPLSLLGRADEVIE